MRTISEFPTIHRRAEAMWSFVRKVAAPNKISEAADIIIIGNDMTGLARLAADLIHGPVNPKPYRYEHMIDGSEPAHPAY